MRHFLCVLCLFFFHFQCVAKESSPLTKGKLIKVDLAADGAILINAKTGVILAEKNCEKPHFPASLTKMATALYALKLKGDALDTRMVASREALASITPAAKKQSNYRSPAYWLETDGTHIGIKKGEEFTLDQLLHAVLISSANDAANVIAENLAGNIPDFVKGLNTYLKNIGCKHSYFLNPNGFHHPEQVTSPYDMALIAKEGMKLKTFAEIVAKTRHTLPKTNLEYERTLVQSNLLQRKGAFYYPKAIGIKTGTTTAAGKNLVAAAQDGDRVLIAVVMGCDTRAERFNDAIRLFETAFKQPKMRRQMLPPGPTKLTTKVKGGMGKVKTTLPDGLYYDYYPAEEVPVKATIKWMVPSLPLEKGAKVGVVRVVDAQGHILQELPLLAAERVQPSLLYRVTHLFSGGSLGKKVFLGLGGLGVIFFLLKLRPRKRSKKVVF